MSGLEAHSSGDEIRAHLERILASGLFQRAQKQSAFLRYIVERALDGEASGLKEYEIGTAVYRRPDDYDPKEDPIVRVEASRLRARLREYYETEGKLDEIRIDVPKGSYTPVFQSVAVESAVSPVTETAVPAGPVPPPRRVWWSRMGMAAGVIAVLAGAGYWYTQDRAGRSRESRKAAERAFRQASQLHEQMTPAAVREAVLLHEAATAADASWPTAHSGLAHVLISLASVGAASRDTVRSRILAEARRSLAMDPSLADGYSALVRYYRDVDLNHDEIEKACRDSVEKVTVNYQILVNCSPVQSARGNHEIAELWARDAVRQSPGWISGVSNLAIVLWRAGKRQEAIETSRRALAITSRTSGPRVVLANAALAAGDPAGAMEVMDRGLGTAGLDREEWYAERGYIAARGGNAGEAERMWLRLREREKTYAVSPVSYALIRIGQGRNDEALALIEEAVRRRDWEAAILITSPEARPLAGDPRTAAAASAMGVKLQR